MEAYLHRPGTEPDPVPLAGMFAHFQAAGHVSTVVVLPPHAKLLLEFGLGLCFSSKLINNTYLVVFFNTL